ncbi:MAG TPA: ATP-binding protein [Chitinophagaceae bacterium]|nr:ATP-binding protein [Chitinophagaceae bacterium]
MPAEEEVILITLVGTFIALFLTVTLFLLYISYKRRRFKYNREREELQITFQQELLRTKLEIQEQTFANISQEIHDNIGQILSLAKLNLNTANIRRPEEAEEKILRSKDLVSKAITDLRNLSKSLNTGLIMKMGLAQAIQQELLLVSKIAQFDFNLNISNTQFRIDNHKELILFRIFQEILNNIITHARAKKVEVTLEFDPSMLTMVVADDGAGFDACAIEFDETRGGLGIRNMHNRATLIGADFRLSSELGHGTTVYIKLPLKD